MKLLSKYFKFGPFHSKNKWIKKKSFQGQLHYIESESGF